MGGTPWHEYHANKKNEIRGLAGAQHKPLVLLRRSALQLFDLDFVSHAANDDEENAR